MADAVTFERTIPNNDGFVIDGATLIGQHPGVAVDRPSPSLTRWVLPPLSALEPATAADALVGTPWYSVFLGQGIDARIVVRTRTGRWVVSPVVPWASASVDPTGKFWRITSSLRSLEVFGGGGGALETWRTAVPVLDGFISSFAVHRSGALEVADWSGLWSCPPGGTTWTEHLPPPLPPPLTTIRRVRFGLDNALYVQTSANLVWRGMTRNSYLQVAKETESSEYFFDVAKNGDIWWASNGRYFDRRPEIWVRRRDDSGGGSTTYRDPEMVCSVGQGSLDDAICTPDGSFWTFDTAAGSPPNALQFAPVTKTRLGRVFWADDGGFNYVADAGAVGVDTFRVPFKAITAGAVLPQVDFKVTITQTDLGAKPADYGTTMDVPLVVQLPATSLSGAILAYQIVRPPAHGTLSVPAGFSTARGRVQQYTPNPGYEGIDSFTFHATSLGNASPTAAISIQVNRAVQRTQWQVPTLGTLVVGKPGVLGTAAGRSVKVPARSWKRLTGSVTSPNGVALDRRTGDLWVTGQGRTAQLAWRRAENGVGSSFGGAGGPVTFGQPQGVTVGHDGTVWIADARSNALHRRDSASGVWSSIPTPSAPWGVALDPQGRLFVSFPSASAVRRYDPTAAAPFVDVGTSAAASGGLVAPKGLAFSPTGDLWVADEGANAVRRLSAGGWTSFGKAGGAAGTGAGEFDAPSGVDVGADGVVWVADTKNARLQSWLSSTSAWTPLIAPANASGGGTPAFTRPYDLAVDPRGDLWVADESPGLQRYAAFQDGTFGFFDVRADGSFVYQARNLAGMDEVTWTVQGPAGATSTVKPGVVVLGA